MFPPDKRVPGGRSADPSYGIRQCGFPKRCQRRLLGLYMLCSDEKDYVRELRRIDDAVRRIQEIGCTQFTDVEQEVNGLVTYDRTYKVDPKIIMEISDFFINI